MFSQEWFHICINHSKNYNKYIHVHTADRLELVRLEILTIVTNFFCVPQKNGIQVWNDRRE